MARRLSWLVMGVLLISIMLVFSGCDLAKKVLPKRCPTSCDDASACTLDICSKDTDFLCSHQEIRPCEGNKICEAGEYTTSTDCPNCDDKNKCTIDKYSYETSECLYEFLPSCCGNSICEPNENAQSCAGDCPSCDDKNSCTQDVYDRPTNKCQNKAIIPCCGNGRCEAGEKYSTCNSDCPPSKEDEILTCGANETCLTDVALKYKDVKICQDAASVPGTESCYQQMALAQNKSLYCTYIDDDDRSADCQESYAVKFRDVSKCPIVNPNNCLESIAILTNNVDLCGGMKEQFVKTRADFVLKCRAMVLNDFLSCKQITNVWIADRCYTDLAVRNKDASLCNAVSLDRQSCEFYVEDAIIGESIAATQ